MAIVAICGIDGAGKTSTCAALAVHPALAGAAVVAKRDRRNIELLRSMFPTAEDDESGLLHGPYAEAIRWGHALDFLRFYEQQVEPHLGAPLLISDRWTVCSIAYADVGTGLGPAIAATLAPCKPADLIVYLDIDPARAIARIHARGDTQGDETLGILTGYSEMYDRWLPKLPSEVVRIPVGDRTPDEVGQLALGAILDRVAPSHASA